MAEGVLSAIGGTPLVRLWQLLPASRFELFAKGGSCKDRPAVSTLKHALEPGGRNRL